MSAILNLRNYKNKSYDVENIFDDNKLKIDLLKVKRFYKKDDTKILNALLKKAAQNKGGTKATKQMYYQSSKKVIRIFPHVQSASRLIGLVLYGYK